MIFHASKHFLVGSALLFCFHAGAQTSQKLPATNPIGSISVDYNTNTPSTTVNAPKDAFDGNFNTIYASFQRSEGWVGLDLGEKYIITKVAYGPRTGWANRLLLGVIEGANSPDFQDAIPLYLITQTPPENRMTEQTINCSRGFRYVRYVGPNDQRCNIAELAFYGYPGNGNDSKVFQTTNLPDVIIHTVNAAEITSRTTYVRGTISIISENGTKIHTDDLDIRGRGNASWGFEKKPYRIKLDSKTRVLNLPANAKNWTLINNWGDKTLMRNLLAFDLSRRFQMPYSPAGSLVNFYLNGEFKGCYQLCDHIEAGTNRVNIVSMSPDDITPPNITGGYCIKIDAYYSGETLWFVSQGGIPVSFKEPNDADTPMAQRNYIREHFNLMETAVFASNYTNPTTGYRRYIDTETFIKFFLIGEISGNTDTYWQTYLYKKRGIDKFFFGPVWDFDLAYENDNRTYPINTRTGNAWIFASTGSVPTARIRNMVNRLLDDPEFVNEMKSIYAYYRDKKIITEEALLKVVDDYANELDASQKLNFTRWDIMNRSVHQNPVIWGSYAAEVNNVKNYIRGRIKWMDNKLAYTPKPEEPDPPKLTTADEMYLKNVIVRSYAGSIHIEGVYGAAWVEIFDTAGRRLLSKTIHGDTVIPMIPFRNGIYVVRLSDKAGNTNVVKCSLGI